MGVQISRSLHSQVPQEDAVRGVEAASWGGIPQIGNAEGVQGRRGAFDARSCSHDDFDPTQICGVASDRVHQGQERYPLGAGLWREEAQLRRAALLGPGILRLDRRSRRSGDQGIHPQAGGRGYPARPNEYVALRPPLGGQRNQGRVSVPTAALSGPIPKATGFAGGYLLTQRLHVGRGTCARSYVAPWLYRATEGRVIGSPQRICRGPNHSSPIGQYPNVRSRVPHAPVLRPNADLHLGSWRVVREDTKSVAVPLCRMPVLVLMTRPLLLSDRAMLDRMISALRSRKSRSEDRQAG